MFLRIHFRISKISSPILGISKRAERSDIPNIKYKVFYENFWNTWPGFFYILDDIFFRLILKYKLKKKFWMKIFGWKVKKARILNKRVGTKASKKKFKKRKEKQEEIAKIKIRELKWKIWNKVFFFFYFLRTR